MAKTSKSVFFCNECGNESSKWLGQCPACKAWNSFVEEKVSTAKAGSVANKVASLHNIKPLTLNEVTKENEERTLTGIGELDRVLGGGVVSGALMLLGGDPGIGKSTLLLQVCKCLSDKGKNVLYISGEESASQIKLRAQRIGNFNDNLKLLCLTDLNAIADCVINTKPDVVIIDSIQTMASQDITSAPGSVSQVREATSVFLRLAKDNNIAIFIVGHVTKDGSVAGPRVLEHMVDTVLYFEGDRHASYRILRGVKNRFGSTDELGVFEMGEKGLREVSNPSEYMLSGRDEEASGTVVACALEGSRPILLEIQALIAHTAFPYPKRQAAGADYNRLSLLMAVLENRNHYSLSDQDAYINVAGGMKIVEPALDLGMVMAIVSSYKRRPLPKDLVVFGEVGLSGEVRSVAMAQLRVKEAKKLGFSKVMLPASNVKGLDSTEGIEIIAVKNLAQACEYV